MRASTSLQDKFIIADPRDNVATARVEVDPGLILTRDNGEAIALGERIPFGHKLALTRIATGEPVLKYGQRIGVAMIDIAAGDLVHVHNLSGERGRGE